MGEYLSENWSISNNSSKLYRVIKELGHVGTVGYIVSDGGTIFVQVSPKDGGAQSETKTQLDVNEKLEFKIGHGWKIGEILLTTDETTAISGRIFIK